MRRSMARIVDHDVERAKGEQLRQVLPRAHIALQDATVGKRDAAKVIDVETDQPRTRKIVSPHAKRWGRCVTMLKRMPQPDLKYRDRTVAQMGKQLVINPRVAMAPEGPSAFIAAVPVGKLSEFVGRKCPIDDALNSAAQR